MKQQATEMSGDDWVFLRTKVRPRYENGVRPVRIVDLFSGCGGITLGVAEACRSVKRPLEVRLAMEIDDDVRRVYDLNFASSLASDRADVRARFDRAVGAPMSPSESATAKDVGALDLLVGGPPCQGHSDLNNYTRREDPKNQLYMVMVRAAEVLRPESLIIENVQGVRRDKSNVLGRAIEALVGLGYKVDQGLVRMVQIGVPQTRVRHILFGSLTSTPSLGQALERCGFSDERTLAWAIGDISDRKSHGIMDTPAVLSEENRRRAKFLLENDLFELPNPERPACHRDNPDHRYGAMYGRLHWDQPARTITTGFGSPGQGRYLHPSRLRTITPREAARLQFFPDWFDFGVKSRRSVVSKCIGNAVPSKLAFVLALDRLVTLKGG